jgi:hypothetical protein
VKRHGGMKAAATSREATTKIGSGEERRVAAAPRDLSSFRGYKRENVHVQRREKTKAVYSGVLCCQCDVREAENTSSAGHASAGRIACERKARRELQFPVAFN